MSVTLHTTMGDIKIEIYCDSVPRTAFNFLALAASGYYDGTLLHRNVRGFMVQGGDPTGNGKGGESIWGGKFGERARAVQRRHGCDRQAAVASRDPVHGHAAGCTSTTAKHGVPISRS